MGEHHVYEFLAIDAPLTQRQMAALRAISTRAELAPTRFFNEYDWGDLKADPAELMRRYFDVHLYQFNWLHRRLMLRLPADRIDLRTARQYLATHSAKCSRSGRYLIIDICSDPESSEDWEPEEFEIASLLPLRAELMLGDLRGCYLAWLSCVQNDEVDEDANEPSVPPGLATLSPAQQALADLLGLEPALLRAAARASAPLEDDAKPAKAWLKKLSQRDKDRWLERAISEPHLALGSEILTQFRKSKKLQRGATTPPRRVADLLAAASAKRPRAK